MQPLLALSHLPLLTRLLIRINNYTFNWERMLSFEGDTGPYLQYAHVRLASIERKNPELLPLPAPAQLKTELLTEPQAREIAFFPPMTGG